MHYVKMFYFKKNGINFNDVGFKTYVHKYDVGFKTHAGPTKT